MKNHRKWSATEIALLLLPPLALGFWGAWLQKQGPSELTVAQIKVTPLPQRTFHNALPTAQTVQAEVFLGHSGKAPQWWGTGVNPSALRVHFMGKNEKDDGSSIASSTGISFDQSRHQYSFVFEEELMKPLDLKQAKCYVAVALETQRVPAQKLAATQVTIPASAFNIVVSPDRDSASP